MNAHAPIATGSSILDEGRSPAEWIEILASRGIELSERTLRERANALEACHKLGRAMIITPAQMDAILEGPGKCRSNPISEAKPGGRAGASNTPDKPSATTIDAALAHLTKQQRGDGAPKRKPSGSVVSFSAAKRHR